MKGMGLLILLAGAGALLMMSHDGTTKIPDPPGPGGTPPRPTGPQPPLPQVPVLPGLDTAGCPTEPNIPPAVGVIWEQVRQTQDPALWLQAADGIESVGYPLLAACIRKQAAKLGQTSA